jgi:hypothetical protein
MNKMLSCAIALATLSFNAHADVAKAVPFEEIKDGLPATEFRQYGVTSPTRVSTRLGDLTFTTGGFAGGYPTRDAIEKILSDFALHPKPNVIKNGFGAMNESDPEAARTVVAIGWGALSGINAVYAPFTGNKERCSYTMEKPDLNYKGHGFFSFTIYNFDGYIATINYAINSDAMEVNEDGAYTVNFLASGEPVKEGEKNIVRTPRGKMWTGVLRNYYPNNNVDELFVWTDKQTAEVSKKCMK